VSKADKTNKGKEVLPVWEDKEKCDCFIFFGWFWTFCMCWESN